MAKCFQPLMSMQASGTIGPRLTFSVRKTGQQVRFQKAQIVDFASWAQLDNQSLYRAAYDRWFCFSAAEKKVYNDKVEAQKLQMSGWNLFLKYAMADPKTYLGLVGYWTFNRPGFGTVLDISKNGNVGTLKPLFPSNCPAYVDSKNKKLGKGLSFDGSNDWVSIADSSSLRPSNFSVSFWAKPDTISDWYRWMGKDHASYTGFIILRSATNSVYMVAYDAGGTEKSSAQISYTVGEWAFFSFTFDGTYIRAYKNGVEITPATNVGAWVFAPSTGSFYVGRAFQATYYKGLFDDVRIYNRALSAGEVAQMYKSTK